MNNKKNNQTSVGAGDRFPFNLLSAKHIFTIFFCYFYHIKYTFGRDFLSWNVLLCFKIFIILDMNESKEMSFTWHLKKERIPFRSLYADFCDNFRNFVCFQEFIYVCYHGFLLFDLWTGIYTIKSYNNKNMHTKLTESSCKQNRTSLVPWYYFLIKLHDRLFFIWCSTNVRLVRIQFICLWINF